MTDKYVVIGNPVAHSKSPQIHALFAAETQQDMSYERLLAPLDGFDTAVRLFFAEGGKGMNVTVPFKEQAFSLADLLTPRGRAAGAINTLWPQPSEDGTHVLIHGDNTDGAGLVADIVRNLRVPIKGKRLLLVGAGGAARGVIMPLLEQAPASLTIVNRTGQKADNLAREFAPLVQFLGVSSDVESSPLQGGGFELCVGKAFDLVINATSTGLSDDVLPLSPFVFARDSLAYDMMYGKETPFLHQAREAGAHCADGLGMLVEQAAEAFHVWRGVRPDTAPVLKALRKA